MVSIALVDARKTSLMGVRFKIAKKSARRYAARGRCSDPNPNINPTFGIFLAKSSASDRLICKYSHEYSNIGHGIFTKKLVLTADPQNGDLTQLWYGRKKNTPPGSQLPGRGLACRPPSTSSSCMLQQQLHACMQCLVHGVSLPRVKTTDIYKAMRTGEALQVVPGVESWDELIWKRNHYAPEFVASYRGPQHWSSKDADSNLDV